MQAAKGLFNIPSQNTNSRFIVFTSKRATFHLSAEISNVIRGSKILSRGRSYAASVPSDPSNVPKAEKGSKRVSRLERKVMVEAFVNSYRAANAGKFPSASNAKNQVGGSYYTVKKIIQEIEYNSRMSPSGNRNGMISTKESTRKIKAVAEIEKVAARHVKAPVGLQHKFPTVSSLESNDATDNCAETNGELQSTLVEEQLSEDVLSQATVNVSLECFNTSDNHSEMEDLQRSALVEKYLSDDVAMSQTAVNVSLESSDASYNPSETKEVHRSTLVEKHFSGDVVKSQASVSRTSFDNVTTENHLHNGQTNEVSIEVMKSLKDGKNEETSAEILQDFKTSPRQPEGEQLEAAKLSMDMSEKRSNGKDIQQKPNLWGNLKSLAHGFMNMWKKL